MNQLGSQFGEILANYKNMTVEYVPQWFLSTISTTEYNPLVFSAIGSVLVGLSGILPLLIIPENLKNGANSSTLKLLLSFAVGGLLGDVFLHLLPEAWENDMKHGTNGHPSLYSGLLVLLGLMVFVSVEKIFSGIGADHVDDLHSPKIEKVNNNTKELKQSGDTKSNGYVKNGVKPSKRKSIDSSDKKKHVAGYLNLMANSIDNFTHGLAVGGSFLISLRLGFLTVFAILVHEIPHEVGDFAILLKSGFTRWDAAIGQIITAGGGLIGAMVAVSCSSTDGMGERVSWILPFTAGGFLHIALVSVLPDLLDEENPWESIKQLAALVLGIIVMAVLTLIE